LDRPCSVPGPQGGRQRNANDIARHYASVLTRDRLTRLPRAVDLNKRLLAGGAQKLRLDSADVKHSFADGLNLQFGGRELELSILQFGHELQSPVRVEFCQIALKSLALPLCLHDLGLNLEEPVRRHEKGSLLVGNAADRG